MSIPYTAVSNTPVDCRYDLTVVTVCRNVLPGLKRTLASVIGQKAAYPNVSIEHVIVDGASGDGTPEWLAEMKEKGHIEAYISEPDRGIYDAMNKGINMAHGAAVYFLNADDTFCHADLDALVRPIVEGKAVMTGGVVHQMGKTFISICPSNLNLLHLYGPLPHQGCFTSTAHARAMGGFDTAHFRCMADTDLMTRIIEAAGLPLLFDIHVADMPLGGFSTMGFAHYFHEYVAVTHRCWAKVRAKAMSDAEYARLVTALLLNHALILRTWQEEHQQDVPTAIAQLQEMCRDLAAIVPGLLRRCALRYAAESQLPQLLHRRKNSLLKSFGILLGEQLCHISPKASSPYVCIVRRYPHNLAGKIRGLKRLFR